MKKMLIANGVIILPDDIVREENLPTNVVKACHLKDLLDAQDKFELKIAPKLKKDSLQPRNNFQGMKVGNARSVINRRTASGLQLLALTTQDPLYITTAWFVNHVNRWFELMTSRGHKLALSKSKESKYKEAIDHLKKTSRLFTHMQVGTSGHWKPVQTGVILATESVLHMQDYLINIRRFKFVLTSRFSQDFLENLFSSVRARQSIPHALAFKNILKVVTIAQYCRKTPGSSYDHDEGECLVEFLSFTKEKYKQRVAEQPEAVVPFQIPRASDEDIDRIFPLWEKYVVYDMCGAVLESVKKVHKKAICSLCYNACLHPTEAEPHQYSVISQLNTITPEALTFASEECFRALAKAEIVFRVTREELMGTKNVNVQDVLVDSLEKYVWLGSKIPQCHSITNKILRRFVAMRWNIYGQRMSAEAREAAKAAYGSKSMAMHTMIR